jgi:hypothetical protein
LYHHPVENCLISQFEVACETEMEQKCKGFVTFGVGGPVHWKMRMMSIVFAYIDPGLGALVWQTIVAAFVGAFFYFRRTRDWILRQFSRIFRRGNPTSTVPASSEKKDV